MHTKLLTISLALLLVGGAYAQESGNPQEKNSFAQNLQNNKIDIYPNPAVDYLIVQVVNSTLEKTQFEMHSIIGNQMTIQVQDLGNGKYRIPVDNLSTGYYFLIIKDESTRFKRAFKFLKD
jgi:hypothetical protein